MDPARPGHLFRAMSRGRRSAGEELAAALYGAVTAGEFSFRRR